MPVCVLYLSVGSGVLSMTEGKGVCGKPFRGFLHDFNQKFFEEKLAP